MKQKRKRKTRKKRSKSGTLVVGLLIVSLLGCRADTSAEGTITPQPFIPPGTEPADTPSSNLEAVSAAPTSQTKDPQCSNQLRFLEDVTIPDGTVVSPGQDLIKQWRIENTGSCDWDKDYSLRLVSGESLSVPTPQHLYPARQGTSFSLQLEFTAPDQPGTYLTMWQAFDPQGKRFGDPFFMEITVEGQ